MNIGGSILPSTPTASQRICVGKHGILRVVPSPELDTHFLTLGQQLLAEHSNGFSCAELAKRILTAWDDPCVVHTRRVLEQVKYINDCGGMARLEPVFREILDL